MLRLALALFFLSFPAHALRVSEHALRIEDRKEGNVLLGAEKALLERGEIYHTVVLLWGNLDVYGEVDEVVVLSGHVVFHDGARVNKSLVVMGGGFESQPGADVKAENVVTEVPGPAWRMLRSAGNLWRENISWLAKAFAGLVSCLLLWLSAWALFHAFPAMRRNVALDWPKNLAVGFLGSIAACVVSVLLVFSIVGILLLPLYLLTLAVFAWIAYSLAALWAGQRIWPPAPGQAFRPAGLLVGFLALQFLWAVPVWWAALPVLALWTLGWGSLLRNLKGLWK